MSEAEHLEGFDDDDFPQVYDIIVCGGRDYRDATHVAQVLNDLADELGHLVIHHGDAPGADTLAASHAQSRGWPSIPYPAEWDKYGPSAGPRRNQRMLDKANPYLVVAFPGGRGTGNMVKLARAKGIPVRKA